MGKFIDLTGQRFGKLLVLERAENYRQPSGQIKTQWLCKCDCGNNAIIRGEYLKSGHTQSCGCYTKEVNSIIHKKYNNYNLSNEYGIGYDSNGNEFYFDLEDYDLIKKYCWNNSQGYIRGNCNTIMMHRLVLGVDNSDVLVDHINHQTNDNRKSNLRAVTPSQNQMNKKMLINNTSGVTGVIYSKRNTNLPWVAQLWHGNTKESKGFATKEEAINQRKNGNKNIMANIVMIIV